MAQGDMFLKIEGAKQGPIKGESQDRDHAGEIDVKSWSWGMEGDNVHVSGQKAITTVHELCVLKGVDSASTALMSSLRSNEPLKKVVLSVRKAGGVAPIEYLKITLEKARLTYINLASGQSSAPEEVDEELRFAFTTITVEYQPQGADGLPRGAMSFVTEIPEG